MSEHLYETFSRADVEDLMSGSSGEAWFDTLGIAKENRWKLIELLASVHQNGIDAGFSMSDFAADDPGTVMEAYSAGIEQGRIEGKEK
jgi:hypothetical protein